MPLFKRPFGGDGYPQYPIRPRPLYCIIWSTIICTIRRQGDIRDTKYSSISFVQSICSDGYIVVNTSTTCYIKERSIFSYSRCFYRKIRSIINHGCVRECPTCTYPNYNGYRLHVPKHCDVYILTSTLCLHMPYRCLSYIAIHDPAP